MNKTCIICNNSNVEFTFGLEKSYFVVKAKCYVNERTSNECERCSTVS